MKPLTERLRAILERRAGLPESRCRDYYALSASRGYDLTGIEGYDPSLLQRAINFTGAVIRHVATGAMKTPVALAAHHVGECESNRCGLFHAEKRVCLHGKCGCYVDTKSTWAEQECPLGLWTDLPPTRHPFARAVTQWAVGITTAPRPQPTILRCLTSLQRSGFEPTVFAEPGSVTDIPGPVVRRKERLGCWRNYVQTLRDLLERNPSAEAIAIFQDDMVACRDLKAYMEHDLWPDINTGMVSMYSSELDEGREGHIDYRKRSNVMGACGIVYPRHVAELLLTDRFAKDWRGVRDRSHYVKEPHLKKATDGWIQVCLRKLGLKIFFMRPSLMQCIDAPSAVGHGGIDQTRQGTHYRKSVHFVGEDVSAFSARQAHVPLCRWTLPAGHQRFIEQETPSPGRPVTVVIPGYGCPDLTRECLAHLERSTVKPSVIYVDDGSTDAEWTEVRAIQTTLPIRHIRHAGNKGFTAACNTGIAAADPTSHVLLLNNDTRIGPHCIERLRWHAERHANVGAVGPVTGDDGAQSIKHAIHRKASKFKGQFATDRYTSEAEKHLTRNMVIEHPVLSGYCMLLNRVALDQLGPLSTAPHLRSGLGADDEWCQRATGAGMRNLLVYNAWCAHLHKTTFKRQGIDRAALQRAAVQGMKGSR